MRKSPEIRTPKIGRTHHRPQATSQSSSVRLAKQTHASFVDTLFMRAHISTLDQEYEAERNRNIELAKQRLLLSQRQGAARKRREEGQEVSPSQVSTINAIKADLVKSEDELVLSHTQTEVAEGSSPSRLPSPQERNRSPVLSRKTKLGQPDQNVFLTVNETDSQNKTTNKKNQLSASDCDSIDSPADSSNLQKPQLMHQGANTDENMIACTASEQAMIERVGNGENADSVLQITTPANMVARLGVANTNTTEGGVIAGGSQNNSVSVFVDQSVQPPTKQPQQTKKSRKKTLASEQDQANGKSAQFLTKGNRISPQVKEKSHQVNLKHQIVSVSAQNGNANEARQIQEAPTMIESLTTKSMKTNTMAGQGGNRVSKILQHSGSNNRRTGQGYFINTDLQQVDEASQRKENGRTGPYKKKMVNKTNTNTNLGSQLMNDGTSSNDDRTLTPNSQLFIFQGKFENKTNNATQLHREQGTPCTLPGDHQSTYYGNNPLQNNTQVKVTAIDVVGKARRVSQIETEMGTQRIVTSKESETYLNSNRVNNISIQDNQNFLGSLLRQSQSGMNLTQEKPLRNVVERDSLAQNSFQERTRPIDQVNIDEDQELQSDDNSKKVEIILMSQGMGDDEQYKRSIMDGLTEQERLEIRQTMKLVYPKLAAASQSKSNSKKLQNSKPRSYKARKQKAAVSKITEDINTLSSFRDQLGDPARSNICSQVQSRRYGATGIFEMNKNELSSLNPRSMIFSQNVPQRILLQAGQSRDRSYGHFSKAPTNMNRGFFQSDSYSLRQTHYPKFHSSGQHTMNTTQSHAAAVTTKTPREVLCSQPADNRPQRSPNGAYQKIDLPEIQHRQRNTSSKSPRQEFNTTISVGMKTMESEFNMMEQLTRNQLLKLSPQVTGSSFCQSNSLKNGNVLKQEQFQFNQIDEQRRMDQDILKNGSAAIIGKKKQIFKRASNLSQVKSSDIKSSQSPTNNVVSRGSVRSPDQTDEDRRSTTKMMVQKSEDMRIGSPPISVGLGVPEQLTQVPGAEDQQRTASKRGKTAHEGKREIPVQTTSKADELPGSTRNHSNSSNMQLKPEIPNVVSSGEVSLMNKAISSQQHQQQNGQDMMISGAQFSLQSQNENVAKKKQHNIYLGDMRPDQQFKGEALSPQTAAIARGVSPDKIKSSLSISQLTNMSNEGYIRRPLLSNQNTNNNNNQGQAQREQNLSPNNAWQPNLSSIAEGGNQKQTTLTMELHPMAEENNSARENATANSEISSLGKAASQLNQKPYLQESDHQLQNAQVKHQRKLSQQEPLRALGQEVLQANVRVNADEEEILVSELNSSSMKEGLTTKKDHGLQDSKQTNYINIHSQKTTSAIHDATRQGSLDVDQSQISLNREMAQNKASLMQKQLRTAVMPLNRKDNKEANDSSQLTSHGNPFSVNGQKVRIADDSNNNSTAHNTTIEHQQHQMYQEQQFLTTSNYMHVQVQSSATKEWASNQENDQTEKDDANKGASVPQKKPVDWSVRTKSSPHLLVLEDQQTSDNKFSSGHLWGGATSTHYFGMVSPKVQIQRNAQQRAGEWKNLQISPTAKNTKHIASGDSSLQYLQSVPGRTQKDPDKPKLGDVLARECQELFRYEDIGYVNESRPNVRLVNKEHVDKFNYAKAIQHRSIGTLEDTGRSYLTMNLEKIDENCQTPDVTIQSTPNYPPHNHGGRMTYELLKNRGDRTMSQVPRNRHSRVCSPMRGMHSPHAFASIERLNAFHRNSQKSKHSRQPYTQSDCKYVLSINAGETLQTSMRRVYGLQPADQSEIYGRDGAISPMSKKLKKPDGQQQTLTSQEQKGFELKKVPILRKDGHVLSDVASPDESRYAKRKLAQKQRKDRALQAQNESKQKQLEMSYHLSSPAARMRNLIIVSQKKRNAQAKPTLSANPVLYDNAQALKTWKTPR